MEVKSSRLKHSLAVNKHTASNQEILMLALDLNISLLYPFFSPFDYALHHITIQNLKVITTIKACLLAGKYSAQQIEDKYKVRATKY